MEGLSIRILLRRAFLFHECYFDVAMCFRPSQQVFQSCRDERFLDATPFHGGDESVLCMGTARRR